MTGEVSRTSCFADLSFLPKTEQDFVSSGLPQDDTALMLINCGRPLARVFPSLVPPLLNTRTAMSIPWYITLCPNLNSRSHTGCDHSATEASRATHRVLGDALHLAC